MAVEGKDLPQIRIRSLRKRTGLTTEVKIEVDLLNWNEDVEAELERLITTKAIIVLGGVPKDSS